MNISEAQKHEEKLVFGEFAKVCSLTLKLETAESRPEPEPDILCELQTGEKLAFELTSADDPGERKKMNDAHLLRKQHRRAYDEAVDKESIREPNRFVGHTVTVIYREKSTTKKKLAEIPRVIELLDVHGPGNHIIRDGSILSINCNPMPVQTNIGPEFHFSTACNVGDYTVERITKKLRKRYNTDHPIHLLVWSNTGGLPELWEEELRRVISGVCPFERVWVFVRCESSIVFVSGMYV